MPLDRREAMQADGWPKMAFIEPRVANDATNWWAPNHAYVEALFTAAAFEVKQRPDHEFYSCEPMGTFESQDLERMLGAVGLP